MNVWVRAVASELAKLGVESDLYTRADAPGLPPVVKLEPGVRLLHLPAGPEAPLPKESLPGYLAAFLCSLLHVAGDQPPYDLIHSHYWLSGWVARLVRERWRVPFVHSFHTLGRVKDATLTEGETPEPQGRLLGEEKVTAGADRLIVPTPLEAAQLVELYGASPGRIEVVGPGVDASVFHPGSRAAARHALATGALAGTPLGRRLLATPSANGNRIPPVKGAGSANGAGSGNGAAPVSSNGTAPAPSNGTVPSNGAARAPSNGTAPAPSNGAAPSNGTAPANGAAGVVRVGEELRPAPAHLLAFVGRLQPLKGPDVAVRALAELRASRPDLDVELLVVGGPSGNGQDEPERLTALAAELGIADRVHFMAAQPREPLADVYRAADLLLVPSRSESFGLVALEAQACGTPVLATRVGGLTWAVGDATTGLLLPDRDPARWAAAAAGVLGNPRRLAAMSQAAAQFSRAHGWGETAERLLGIYRGLTDAADGAVLERTS